MLFFCRSHNVFLWLLLAVGLLPGWCAATASVPMDVSRMHAAPVSLTSYFDVLEDPSRELTLQDVQTPAVAQRFQGANLPAESLSYGATRSAYWLRLLVRNSSPVPVQRMLEIANARLTSVDFYSHNAVGLSTAVATGMAEPFASRPYANRFFVFPVDLPPAAERFIYIRVLSTAPLFVPARIWEPNQFHGHERNDYQVQSVYFGMCLAMVLFNLLLFVSLRDSIYMYYVALILCVAVSLASLNGLAKEYLWPDATHWSDVATSVGFAACFITVVLFLRKMLQTKAFAPRLDRVLLGYLGLMVLMAVGFMLSVQSMVKPGIVLFAVGVLLTLATAIYFAVKRHRSAYFFLGAFAFLIVGILVFVLRGLNWVPTNAWTLSGMQFGSAMEMILLALALADRFNQMRHEGAQAQQSALEAEYRLVNSLKESERQLEERVAQRTTDLAQALQSSSDQRQQAEAARQSATVALEELRTAQTQLIQAEKMATLGQVVANVAHEINTPIGAVKASGKNISDALEDTLNAMPELFQTLDVSTTELFKKFLQQYRAGNPILSTRDERNLVRALMAVLEQAGVDNARKKASILAQMGAKTVEPDYLPLLLHPESDRILATAHGIASILNNTANINSAVEKVSKIVFALKSFSHVDQSEEKIEADIFDGMETVLTIYQGQLKQGIELVREYETIAPLLCLPDQLNQVWTNLIHNALQAMQQQKPAPHDAVQQASPSTLTIAIRQIDQCAVVSVRDNGPGIPEHIRTKIFEPFFTTKPVGVGSGLGLDIVRKIIDKHQGRIELQTEVGVGTTFTVYLPYP
jgi:signal transduction histidine kinase